MEKVAPAELSTTAAPVVRLALARCRLDGCYNVSPVKYMSQNLSVILVISSTVRPMVVSETNHVLQASNNTCLNHATRPRLSGRLRRISRDPKKRGTLLACNDWTTRQMGSTAIWSHNRSRMSAEE